MRRIPGCTLTTPVLFLRDWKVSSHIQFVAKLEGSRCQSTLIGLEAKLAFAQIS